MCGILGKLLSCFDHTECPFLIYIENTIGVIFEQYRHLLRYASDLNQAVALVNGGLLIISQFGFLKECIFSLELSYAKSYLLRAVRVYLTFYFTIGFFNCIYCKLLYIIRMQKGTVIVIVFFVVVVVFVFVIIIHSLTCYLAFN